MCAQCAETDDSTPPVGTRRPSSLSDWIRCETSSTFPLMLIDAGLTLSCPLQVRPCPTPSLWSRVFRQSSPRSPAATVLWRSSSSRPERFGAVQESLSGLSACPSVLPEPQRVQSAHLYLICPDVGVLQRVRTRLSCVERAENTD